MEKSVKLKQVAALAGVSISTVSRAVAKPDTLHPDTLSKVREAIASLDYVPFAPARVLRSGRTLTIGIVAPTILNELYAVATDTLEERLERLGYTVLLVCHRDNEAGKTRAIRALIERGVDGLAIIGSSHHHEIFSLLDRRRVPYVLMWAADRSRTHPTVGYDQKLAMLKITDHLARLGHSRFAALPGPLAGHQLSEERLAGAREGLGGAALRVVATPYDPEEVRRATGEILSGGDRATAIICGNDMIAAAAIAECRRRGVDCPTEISITGFGDWGLARLMSPALTTIRSDAVRIGSLTADNLLAQIQASDVGSLQFEYEPELVVRESTAEAPN